MSGFLNPRERKPGIELFLLQQTINLSKKKSEF